MSFLDNYKTLLGHTSTSGTSSDRTKIDLIARFNSNPSYAKTTVVDTVGNISEKEILTTKIKETPEQKFLSHPNQPLASGMELISVRSARWLVLDTFPVGEVNQELKVIKLKTSIKWMDGTQVKSSFCSVLSKGGLEEGSSFFSVPGATAMMYIQKNATTNRIQRNKRIMINDYPFKVLKIDNYTYDGVLILILSEDQFSAADNREEGICDYNVAVTPTLNFIAGDATIPRGKSKSYQVFINNTAVIDATWSLSANATYANLTTLNGVATVSIENSSALIGETFQIEAVKDAITISKEIKVVSLM